MADSNELQGDKEPVSPDLIFGHWQFGLAPETLSVDRPEEKRVLEEDGGPEAVIAQLRKLFDAVTTLEASGLSGDELFGKVAEDSELVRISRRYAGFVQNRPWRDRFQGIWASEK